MITRKRVRYFFLIFRTDGYLTEKTNFKHGFKVSTSNLEKPPRPKEVINWPSNQLVRFGQITAVAINPHGNPVIFHRGDRIWTEEYVIIIRNNKNEKVFF